MSKRVGLWVSAVCMLLIGCLLVAWIKPRAETPYGFDSLVWTPYEPGLIERLQNLDSPLLVHFSADWDVHTKWPTYLQFESKRIAEAIRQHEYTLVYVDCTENDSPGWPLLQPFQTPPIPVALLLHQGRTAKLGTALTSEQMADAVIAFARE